jgi:hypothetical protein
VPGERAKVRLERSRDRPADFDTDYLLVKDTDLGKAISMSQRAGHSINE